MKNRLIGMAVAAAAGLFGLVAQASAGTVTYSGYTVLNQQNVHITDLGLGINNEYGGAGQITLTGTNTPGGSLAVWCVDIADYLQGNGTFGVDTLTISVANQINALISNGTPLLAGSYDASAALQVAIWEVEYGSAVTITPDNAAVGILAATYIANVTGGIWQPDPSKTVGTLLGYGRNQNQAYLVPEPASMALLGIGLAGLGLIRRRRA